MNIETALSRVPIISKERDYWFVRTDGGQYFDTFYENNFIGIGWNEILLEDIVKKDPFEVHKKISKLYSYNSDSSGKRAATSVYNKLIRFNNLQEGDVVVIPDAGSANWAFGTIQAQRPYIDNDRTGNCDFAKRRKILWEKKEHFNLLDPIFNQIKRNQHSISSINNYASYIDIVTNSLYYKGDSGHLVLSFRTQDEINAKEFFEFGNAVIKVLEAIEKEYNFGEKIEETTLKLYLQSPGKAAFKTVAKKSIATLGLILAANMHSPNGASTSESDETLKKIGSSYVTELNVIHDTLQKMRTTSIDEINAIYNGNK